jgi:hypothetical protein
MTIAWNRELKNQVIACGLIARNNIKKAAMVHHRRAWYLKSLQS